MAILSSEDFQLIVMDMSMPYVTGWELLPQIVAAYPDIPVVILSAFDEVKLAVQSMKDGAFDYLVKPVDDSRLITTVKKAIEFRELRNENSHLKHSLLSGELAHPEAFDSIVTRSRLMRAIFQYIEAIAQTPLPVLITGETGVGKEMVGKAIHALSGRRGQMVSVNMAGLDDNLFSDTLFGHRRGGFTGADWDRKGLIEQAAHGTLFLDEIGDLSMESQVKLLRLLQEGMYFPIGSDVVKFTDARFIAATNCGLNEMQQSGRFRKDLYYRLSAHRVDIPPLRKRREDIPLLVDHFLERAAAALDKRKPTPPRELFTLLENHLFAGNVRELEGMIVDVVSQHKGGVLSVEAAIGRIALCINVQRRR
jgi:DNA-binding NtrC family response regulator